MSKTKEQNFLQSWTPEYFFNNCISWNKNINFASMDQVLNRGGMVVGPSHAEGGVPFMLQDTGRHIEEEGMEINIPRELSESPKKYSFRGTNARVLDQILKLAGLSVTDKVTNVRSGDIVICVRSAWDQKKRAFTGTIKEILHEINTSGGCKPIIDPKSQIPNPKSQVTAKNGGTLPKGVKPRVKDWQAEDPNSPRWKKKKQRIEELSNGIHKLRLNVSRDIQSPDERTALTALIVAVMDRTAERIGNDDSADNGHFGVTGFRKKHISVVGSTVHLDYVGKSGTKHEKSFTDARLAKALKKAIKNAPGKFIFETSDGFRVKSDKVNRYLQQFNISAKDMRGYNANRWIIEKLKAAANRQSAISNMQPEKAAKERKKIFNKAVKETAGRVGHGASTLKKHYMIPELPIQYIQHGRIIDMKNLGYYMEGGELAKGIEVEKEHRNLFLKLKKRLEAQGVEMPITEQDFYKEIAKAHIKERKDYYDLLEKYVEKYTMGNGGPTPLDEKKQQAQELAKKFIDSLSSADIQTIKQEMQTIVNTSIVEEETKLNDLIAQKKAFKEEIKELYEKEKLLSYGEEKTKIWNRREFLDYQIGILEPHILHQQNIIKAIRNGGDTTSFADKKGLEHKQIPYFSNIKTDNISFDEETILTDAVPAYIPFINEQMFKRKGYVFDAIRIARDEYLIAINGYNEKRQAMSRQEERKVSDFPHPDDSQQGYVITTLDQLALISDYYFTKARAEAQKKADESTKHNEEYYDKLPRERRERHLNQKGFYHSLPVKVKKIITQEDYEALSLEEKEKLYKPFKKYGPERLKSNLDDQHMWVSYHNMYERFINPAAVSPRQGTANPEVFQYWENFRDMMKWKIKDIQVQREVDSEIRKIALETSFGESNTNDVLKEEYGILVKRQNGTKIGPDEIEQIRKGWVLLNKTFGNLVNNAKNDNLKISHTGLKYVFASKAAGMYVPSMKTIAVSNKFGEAQFDQIFSHETAHWIDGNMGALIGKRHATDDFESTAGRIASTFRKNMNAKSDSDYVNSTVECFARAMEQYFAFENYGEETELLYSYGELKEVRTYHSEEKYTSKENFNTKIKPLIQQFLAENQEWFKFGIEVPKEVIPKPVIKTKSKHMQQESDYQTEMFSEGGVTGMPSGPITAEKIKDFLEGELPSKIPAAKDKISFSSTYDLKLGERFPFEYLNIKPIPYKVGSVDEPLKNLVGRDDLRPNMMGIFYDFENKQKVATNAHVMAIIKDESITAQKLVDPFTGKEIDARYPAYMSVIPKENPNKIHLTGTQVDSLINELNGISRAKRFINSREEHKIVARIKHDDLEVYVNPVLLMTVIKALKQYGATGIDIEISTPNRGILIVDSRKNGNRGLVMPVMFMQDFIYVDVLQNSPAEAAAAPVAEPEQKPIERKATTKTDRKPTISLHDCAVRLGRKGGQASAKARAKMGEGGVISESDIKKGARFKNEAGTIFIIDKVYKDPIFGIAVQSSLEGGEKGNYKDSIEEVAAFLNEEGAIKLAEGGPTPSCVCFSSYMKTKHPDLSTRLLEEDINSNPSLRSMVDKAYKAWQGGKLK